ncbi:MAG: RsmB/NOP family class I SAM-dependent RNA methyltransferase [bacterium]
MKLQSLIGHLHELLLMVRESTKPADSVIDSFFRKRKYLGSQERKFIATGTYGVLRHLRLCEHLLQKALAGHHKDMGYDDRMLLLIAAYLLKVANHQLSPDDVLQKIVSPSIKSYLPSLLEGLRQSELETQDDLKKELALRYSYTDWMAEKIIKEYGGEAKQLCEAMNQQAPIQLRVNTVKTTLEECQKRLARENIIAHQNPAIPNCLTLEKRINVFSLSAFKDGWFEMQDAGSQILPLLIDPKPTAKLLDACAGAGGKTLEFAALMKNRGEIVAADIHSYRLDELRRRMKRAGVDTIRIKHVATLSDLERDHLEYFDIVFVDAPCSGSGTIRRNPGMKWSITSDLVTTMAEKQLAILGQCVPLVKPQGRLVYATCSLFRDENEDVVERFLNTHPEFECAPFSKLPALEGIASPSLAYTLLPHRHNTDGFFCVSMLRKY